MEVAKPPVYNSLWQLRADSWSGLEEASERLAVAVTQERPTEHLVKEVDRLLDVLAPMEVYWAFPGVQTFQHARRLFGAGKYDRLARLIARDQPRVDHGFLPQRRTVVGRAPGPRTAERRRRVEPGTQSGNPAVLRGTDRR